MRGQRDQSATVPPAYSRTNTSNTYIATSYPSDTQLEKRPASAQGIERADRCTKSATQLQTVQSAAGKGKEKGYPYAASPATLALAAADPMPPAAAVAGTN